jgi:glycosyltransferase involved in cell wall biosynthesis
MQCMKICYVFTGGRKERLRSQEPFPEDLFYGYLRLGGDKKIVQQSDFIQPPPAHGFRHRILAKLLSWMNVDYSFLRTIVFNRDLLEDADTILLTTNSQGIHFSCLKVLGFFRGKRIFFIPMGLYSRNRYIPWLAKLCFPIIFRGTRLLPISIPETEVLQKRLFLSTVAYVPFGVDTDFWTPAPQGSRGDEAYVLSVGNDMNRDYELLIGAWKPGFPLLKIITSQPLPARVPANVQIVNGDWRRNLIPDEEIRAYYRNALFVITPLKETSQPSGQSATLQAMSCAKAVILTRIGGLWAPESLRHLQVCYLTRPGSREDLQQAVTFLWNSPQEAKRVGESAHLLIRERFNSRILSQAIESIISRL